ncbi:MAG: c-type cytochrome [Actinomycetia bacterium]|nr:c-type cytochrome [Actinomycetes bacterium]
MTFLILAMAVGGAVVFGGASAGAGPVARVLPQADTAAGAQVFADNCSSCHQADGSGIPGSFPPLLGNANALDPEYVETVVRSGLEGPIEALGVSYDSAMPSFSSLSDAEVANVVAFVVTLAERDPAGTGSSSDEDTDVVEVEPGDVDEGHELFIGADRFTNGGAACAGCHTAGKVGNLGGWGLGPDLTDVVARLGSEAALASWLTAPPTPTMQPVFADHPLTPDEVADVAVFLSDAPSQTKQSDPGDGLILAGGAGLLLLIGGMAVAWRGMRQTYEERLRSRR